jgi:hypothetical protein
MKVQRLAFGVLAAISASAITLQAADANASNYRKVPGTACQMTENYAGAVAAYEMAGVKATGGTSGAYASFTCPFYDDSTMPKGNIATLTADVYNPTATDYASADVCAMDYYDYGGSCAPYVYIETAGYQMLTLSTSTSIWADNPYSYAMISLILDTGSSFFGWYAVTD